MSLRFAQNQIICSKIVFHNSAHFHLFFFNFADSRFASRGETRTVLPPKNQLIISLCHTKSFITNKNYIKKRWDIILNQGYNYEIRRNNEKFIVWRCRNRRGKVSKKQQRNL